MSFVGAKLALFCGTDLVVLLRDDYDWIPFPNCWDFPGGERDGAETPEACVLRETREEIALSLAPDDLIYRRRYDSHFDAARDSWFFAARMPAGLAQTVRLGDEGQTWRLMPPEAYLGLSDAVPFLQERLRDYLRAQS